MMKVHKLHCFLLLFIITIGFIFTIAVPPFQKPDEVMHFNRTVLLSRGHVFCDRDTEFVIPKKYLELPHIFQYERISFTPEEKFDLSSYSKILGEDENVTTKIENNTCNLFFIGYIPNVVGVLIGQAFNSPIAAFFLGRIMGLCFFVATLIFFVRRLEKYKPILYFYALIPMVLHQVTSFSYDVVQLTLALAIAALLLEFIEKKKVAFKQYVLFGVILSIFILVKPGYYAFVALLLVPLVIVVMPKLYYFVAMLAFFIWNIGANYLLITRFSSSNLMDPSDRLVVPAMQREMLIHDPLYLVTAIINSLEKFGDFYFRGMIGIFGWLDYQAEFWIYYLFVFLLSYVVYFISRFMEINRKSLLIFLLFSSVIAGTLLLVFTSLYLFWTTLARSYVEGVQGRYFLVLTPLIVYCLAFALRIVTSNKKASYVMASVIFTVLSLQLFLNVYNRYYVVDSLKEMALEDRCSAGGKPVNDYYVIDKKTQVLLDSASGLTGIKMKVSSNSSLITTPYRIYIKDHSCTNTYYAGYLDQVEIHNKEVINIIPDRKIGDKSVCVELIPLQENYKEANYLYVGRCEDEYLIQVISK